MLNIFFTIALILLGLMKPGFAQIEVIDLTNRDEQDSETVLFEESSEDIANTFSEENLELKDLDGQGVEELNDEPQSLKIEIPFSDFIAEVDAGNINNVIIKGNNVEGYFEDGRSFYTYSPNYPNLVERLNTKGVKIAAEPIESINQEVDNLKNTWKNSSLENLVFLFEKLNNNISSHTIRINLIDSLIYGETPPNKMSSEEFDKIRILTLKKLGALDSAITLINNIPTYEKNKNIYDLILLEKNLIDYDLVSVCNLLESGSNFEFSAYVIKINIFCSYLNNDLEKAEFYNTLLLEENENDEYFQALYNNLIGLEKDIKQIGQYNYDKSSIILYSAVMRSINLPFTNDFVNLGLPQLLKTIAISPSTELSVRIEAAQKAYKLDVLSSESVAAIYQSVDFTGEELQNPLITIENNYSNESVKALALLFQSSRIQILPISRLEALSNFWTYAKNVNQTKLAYELSKDLLKTIEPTTELIDFALQTAMVHFYNNNIDSSKDWLKLVEANIQNENNNQIEKEYFQLIFLMSLEEGRYEINFENFLNTFNDFEIDQDNLKFLELYLTTLEYIGFDIPVNLWEMTAKKEKDQRTIPSIYIMKLIKESAENNLLGNLLLNIAISMEDNNWHDIHPQHVGLIFDNLKIIKEEKIIKDLAIEILKDTI